MPDTSTATQLVQIICEMLAVDPEQVTPDASLAELGADSLDMVELVMACEQDFGVSIDDEQIEKLKTVKDLSDLIDELK